MKEILRILFIVAFFSIRTNAKRDCEDFRTTIRGTNYLITCKKHYWERALQICKEKEMELVSINSKSKYEDVNKIIEESGLENRFWTSGTDLNSETNFYWASNNQSFAFNAPWHTGQPDSVYTDNGEHCVDLNNWMGGNSYKLNDNHCHMKFYAICSSGAKKGRQLFLFVVFQYFLFYFK